MRRPGPRRPSRRRRCGAVECDRGACRSGSSSATTIWSSQSPTPTAQLRITTDRVIHGQACAVTMSMTLAHPYCDSLGPGRLPRRRPTWRRPHRPEIVLMPAAEPAPGRDMDAATLVVRIADQDREAFKALFTGFAPRVKTYLLRHGATPAQAD